MSGLRLRIAMIAVCGGGFAALPAPAWAYGIDGLFGGRPNPDGSQTAVVPMPEIDAPDRAVSVLDHPHPDYDPLPLRVGSFLVSPSVEAGLAYNSNVYNIPAPALADEVIALHPAVTAVSDWSRNMLAVTANGDFDFFQNHPSQNLDNDFLQVDGRYDLMNQTWLAGTGGYQSQSIPRYDLSNSADNQPTIYNLYTAGVSAYRGAGLLHAQANYTFNRYDFNNTAAADLGGGLNIAQLNRDINTFGGRLAYAAVQDFQPYVSAQYNIRTYDVAGSRASSGSKTDVGVAWDAGGITSLDIYTGWLQQSYPSFAAGSSSQSVDFGGKLTWNVTGLTTVVLDANRSIEDSDIVGFSSFIASGGAATVTHELRRNILLETDLAYTNNDYTGLGSRQDHIEVAGAGARYLINRNLYADLDYSWNHRASTVEDQGYVDHLVVVKLGVRF